MKGKDFGWQTNEFMLYCRTSQLREKSMMAYEQSLKLFQRWCMDEMGIFTVDKVTENVIRRYIIELQERGKYTFYAIDKQKKTNYPERRRDFRQIWIVLICMKKAAAPFGAAAFRMLWILTSGLRRAWLLPHTGTDKPVPRSWNGRQWHRALWCRPERRRH